MLETSSKPISFTRILIFALSTVLVVLVGMGIWVYSNLDTVWNNPDTWITSDIKFPFKSDPEYNVSVSQTGDTFKVSVTDCVLYDAVQTETDVTYRCNYKLGFEHFTAEQAAQGVKYIAGKPIVPDVVVKYHIGKDPWPISFLNVQLLSESSFTLKGFNPLPTQVNLEVEAKKPDANFASKMTHFLAYIQGKPGVYSTSLKSWEFKATTEYDAESYLKAPPVIPTDVVYPWKQSELDVPNLVLPDTIAADTMYRNAQKAILSRDYDSFVKLASAERVWYTNNPAIAKGTTKEGYRILEKLPVDAIENYKDNAVCNNNGVNTTPTGFSVSYQGKVEKYTIAQISGRKYLVYDPVQRQYTLIAPTEWKNAAKLTYSVDPNQAIQGTGTVVFVYDNGKWKYHGEAWDLTYANNNFTSGDDILNKGASDLVTIGDDAKLNNFPANVTIKLGQTLIWKNLQGMVSSFNKSPLFDSAVLDGQSFAKKFDQRGVFKYKLCVYSNEFTGTVTVQ